MSSNSAPAKLNDLQILRAAAATLVAFSHMSKELTTRVGLVDSGYDSLLSGVFGVDLFFVISGFIMILITASPSSAERNPLEFLARRFVRIAPVYWFYMTAFIAMGLLASHHVNHSEFSASHVAASYFFIPSPRPLDGAIEPTFALGWTLNYEMYFYLIFAVILMLPRRFAIGGLVGYFCATVLLGSLFTPEWAPLWYWTRSNVLEFVFGAVIAHLFLRGVRVPVWAGIGMILLGIVLWQIVFASVQLNLRADFQYAPPPEYRGIFYGIPAALLVAGVMFAREIGAVLTRGRVGAFAVLIGDASFSLYLVHMFAVRATSLIFPFESFGAFAGPLFLTVGLAACFVAAIASYKLLEAPIHIGGRKAVRRIFARKAAAKSDVDSISGQQAGEPRP